jgi:hypothetical protein
VANGKLIRAYTGELVMGVNYRLLSEETNNWWGELTLDEFRRIDDGDGYILELADGRRGRCFLTRNVNKAVSGFLPLYCYRFRGSGDLKKQS